MWHIDSEACLMDPAAHGATDSGKYLVMLMIRREKLLVDGRRADSDSAPAKMQTDYACRSCMRHFAQLRESLKKEKRMVFVIAEHWMLNTGGWSRLYGEAANTVNSPCPMIVWHPKRKKCQMMNCTHVQTCQHALEQTLDGNVKGWLLRPWPA